MAEMFSGRCSRGLREQQQDAYVFCPLSDGSLVFVVCDGMGGHRNGDLAAKAAVTAFANSCYSSDTGILPHEMLSNAMNRANEAVAEVNQSGSDDEISGCTIVAGYRQGYRLWFVSVGDSPLWVYRSGKILRLNKDHSMRSKLAAQVLRGEISEKDFDSDKRKNSLLAALTGEKVELIDSPSIPRNLEADDIILAATDGILTLETHEIAKICNANADLSMDKLTKALIEAVRGKGKENQDNTTVAVIKCLPTVS